MKVTKSYLKRIIKEEFNKLQEVGGTPTQKAQRAISDAIEEIQVLVGTENASTIRYSLKDPVLGYLQEALENLSQENSLEEITTEVETSGGDQIAELRNRLHEICMKNRIHLPQSAFGIYSNVQIVSVGADKAEVYDSRRNGAGSVTVTPIALGTNKKAGSPSTDQELVKKCTEVMDAYKAYMKVKLNLKDV
jgi:hypothetical protein